MPRSAGVRIRPNAHLNRCVALSNLFAVATFLSLAGCYSHPQKDKKDSGLAANTPFAIKDVLDGAELIGVWEGPLALKGIPGSDAGIVRYEFKANGRWSGIGVTGLMLQSLPSPIGGTWKIGSREGNLLIIHATNDLFPANLLGWRATVTGVDEISLEEPEGTSKLKRKR